MTARALTVAAAGSCAALALLPARAGEAVTQRPGESIYLRGSLSSGAPLEGVRPQSGLVMKGADAACVNCHQHSGLGSEEGGIAIPPVTGQFLFQPRERTANEPQLPYVENMHGNRAPYTEETLARAIRAGLDSQGRPLSNLMPRFALDDADMSALITYLNKLSVRQIPGVSDSTLQFATVFTPDADPVKRRGVLDVLEHYVVEKNRFPLPPSPRMWSSGKTAYAKSMYMANRHWQLHVWDLSGPASTWRAQLQQHLHDEPVYALLSGLGGSNWAPVHEFCQENQLPCLFPNIEVPVEADRDFYVLYFSKGVLLESQLIAKRILDSRPHGRPDVVVQVYRRGDSGEAAARALAAQLETEGIRVRSRELPPGPAGHGVTAALSASETADALVLWLRPTDIAALGHPPSASGIVYMSGLMGGLEDAPLAAAWRERTHLAYPFDLPDRRGIRLDYPLGWFTFRQIPVVAMQVQADTYLACSLLTETMKSMADVISREYLIEQMQGMLERRLVTGHYPRLALAQNQRFASKGGYIAHFRDSTGPRLLADSDWIVPESVPRSAQSPR
jgi:Cytochrome c